MLQLVTCCSAGQHGVQNCHDISPDSAEDRLLQSEIVGRKYCKHKRECCSSPVEETVASRNLR